MATKTEVVAVSPPNFQVAKFRIRGETPYMQARFAAKAMQAMRSKQQAGSSAKKGTAREARDFDRDFIEAQHRAVDGWNGIPAPALRNACIDACRMVGFEMTRAKMSVFILPDGFDAIDGTPLIKLDAEPPERTEMIVRNATGVADIRVRPMWRQWAADVSVRFDADQFTLSDVTNLLSRAGQQVGIGEGRPFSKRSAGLDFGRFTLEE
jgi:hypothetical protein